MEREKFIRRYEAEHPEQRNAWISFFNRIDACFLDDVMQIKYMFYQLEADVLDKMLAVISGPRGIYIRMFKEKNPKKTGASAYYGRDFWGRPRIMYYEMDKKRQLKPPYKTIFHEFGHGIDDWMKKGKGFYSDTFCFAQEAEKNELRCTADGVILEQNRQRYDKTIHQWAAFDVENYLLQTAVKLQQAPFSRYKAKTYPRSFVSPQVQYRIIKVVVYDLFLQPDGQERVSHLFQQDYAKLGTFSNETNNWIAQHGKEIRELYEDIQKETESRTLDSVQGVIVLPKDIFGGITNNQLGGGHQSGYWFKKNRRIREVSREAFAGYFEYRAILPAALQDRVINPYQCMPCTTAALMEMQG